MGEWAEKGAAFTHASGFEGLARFRHFGSEGPLYEVLSRSGDQLRIVVVESGEQLDYAASAAEQDPVA